MTPATRGRPPPMHVSRRAGNGPELVPGVVQDPYDGKPLPVIKNAKASHIHHLAARGRLGEGDDRDARLAAAERFRRIYERAEIGGPKAVDYSRVKVDVSFRWVGVADHVIDAVKELATIRKALRRHYDVVEKIAGHGYTLGEVGGMVDGGPMTWRTRKFVGKVLVDGLDMLIEHFGVARGRVVVPMRAHRDS